VLLDVYHHAGVLPLDLAALKADFAVGGSYKYTRGGPGACWLYVRPGLVETLRTPDTGWFAKKDMFTYARPEPPEFGPGGDAWLESTPPVLAPIQALAGLELTLELGVERIRQHNLEQKELLASLIPGLEGAGADHGAFVTLKHPGAQVIVSRLRDRKVKTDARGDYLRICPDILNTRAELEAAASKTISAIG
jgi:kynureninase